MSKSVRKMECCINQSFMMISQVSRASCSYFPAAACVKSSTLMRVHTCLSHLHLSPSLSLSRESDEGAESVFSRTRSDADGFKLKVTSEMLK